MQSHVLGFALLDLPTFSQMDTRVSAGVFSRTVDLDTGFWHAGVWKNGHRD